MARLPMVLVGTAPDVIRDIARAALVAEGDIVLAEGAAEAAEVMVLCLDLPGAPSSPLETRAYDYRYVWTSHSSPAEWLGAVREVVAARASSAFTSTRGDTGAATFASVVREGLAADGGLYLLRRLPRLPPSQWRYLVEFPGLDYVAVAQSLVEGLTGHQLPPATLHRLLRAAYHPSVWSGRENICPLSPLVPGGTTGEAAWMDAVALLELHHGPTAAFKDFALQLFPHFFDEAVRPTAAEARYVILTATSGDTGVAALSGFCRSAGPTRVMVLYPSHGVSPVQRMQMIALEGVGAPSGGGGGAVVGVDADFDHCQSTVKALFADAPLRQTLAQLSPPRRLSSANSINWGRLIPQVVYYVWCYRQTMEGRIGEAMDVVVPCGNFGNILAAYIAKRMGLPLRTLVVASNANDVLYEFIQTGRYDVRARRLTQTASPSIDILKASNVERLLYLVSDGDTATVARLMQELETEGVFSLPPAMWAVVRETFWAGRCEEAACAATIREVFHASRGERLVDPHTAVALFVAKAYRAHRAACSAEDHPAVPLVVVSTAHWAKFPEPVLAAVEGRAHHPSESGAGSTVEDVEAAYERLRVLAKGHATAEVHPALKEALRVYRTRVQAPRQVPANRAAMEDALIAFASA